MEQLIATIEKGKPFFNAIARNKYLKAIRDGFISVIPIIIFSSIFILVDAVPNVWGFYWPAEIDAILMKAYNYSMGILALGAAATTAKHFCDAQNRDMPKNNQINFLSVMILSLIHISSPLRTIQRAKTKKYVQLYAARLYRADDPARLRLRRRMRASSGAKQTKAKPAPPDGTRAQSLASRKTGLGPKGPDRDGRTPITDAIWSRLYLSLIHISRISTPWPARASCAEPTAAPSRFIRD